MTREKHVLAIGMQVFTITCLITVLWLIFGYSLAFAPISAADNDAQRFPVYGSGERLWLLGLGLFTTHQLAPTIPEALFCAYELTFAIITAALICGSFADRMRYTPMMLFISLWHLAVYCPIAHANWHPSGCLYSLGVLDYAGGNVVHISSGVSGLATVLIIGNRRGFDTPGLFPPHNILLTFMGMSMLWVGWFGFNAGSAYGANPRAAFAMLATQISTAVCSLTWMFTEWAVRKKPSVLGMISGAVAGLVCITPAAGYVDMTGAFFIGFFGGPLCYLGAQLKHSLGYDDALDAFGVHAIGGIVGGIATGFFATATVTANGGPQNEAPRGVYYSNMSVGGNQLAKQLCGVLFAIGWAFCGTLIILKAVEGVLCVAVGTGASAGLRASADHEAVGLDASFHDERAYKAASAGEVVAQADADADAGGARGLCGVDGANGAASGASSGTSSGASRVSVLDVSAMMRKYFPAPPQSSTAGADPGAEVETGEAGGGAEEKADAEADAVRARARFE